MSKSFNSATLFFTTININHRCHLTFGKMILWKRIGYCKKAVKQFCTRAHPNTSIISLCERFAKERLKPVASKLDENGSFPSEEIRELGKLGLMGIVAPPEYGGSGCDYTSLSLAVDLLSQGCASTGAIVSIHNILYVDLLSRYGTTDQKAKFLAPYTSGKLGSFALSESEAGSDVANISTTAAISGDNFILNGSKAWVTSAHQSDYAIVFATVDKTLKHRGITGFMVPLSQEGVFLGKPEDKLGIRAVSTCQISLCNVCIPSENIIGGVGNGFKIAMEQLNRARIGIASQALGIAQASLDTALEYAMNRRAFGHNISDFQAVQIRLARMATQIEASRLLVRKAAELCDKNENIIKSSAMAKLFASETATFAAHQCIQILGGVGYTKGMPAERHYRDARVTEIYGGVSDIQMLIIADKLLNDLEKK